MRPLILTMEGIRSYPGACPPIDFTGKTRIGIIGDTGAGKSTIFEALCVALYGGCSIPSADIRDLIADNCPAMSVELTFRHGDATWRVRRKYFANSRPSQHVLENLDTSETIDNARQVTARIVALTGLNLDAFRSSVLLPQGRFAELLQAAPAKRTKLLEGLFGAETLTTITERVRECERSLLNLLHRAELARKSFHDNPMEVREQALARAQAAKALATSLSEQLGQIRAQHQAVLLAGAEIDHLEELERKLADALRDIDSLRTSIDNVDQRRRSLDVSSDELDQEEARLGEIVATTQAALDAAAADGNTPRALAVAEAHLKKLTTDINKVVGARDASLTAKLQLNEHKAAQAREATDIAEAAVSLAEVKSVAKADDDTANGVQWAVDKLMAAFDLLLDHSVAIGHHSSELAAILQRIDGANLALPGLVVEVEARKLALRQATGARDRLQRQEYAACAGHDLHPGDACPICRQDIPADYLPTAPVDPTAATAADDLVETCRGELATAEQALSSTDSSIEADQRAVAQRLELRDSAAVNAACTVTTIASLMQSLDQLTSTHEGRPDPTTVFARIRQAHIEIALTPADPRRVRRHREKKKVSAILTQYATAAHERARKSSLAASLAASELEGRQRAAQDATAKLKQGLTAHQQALLAVAKDETELRKVITSLPASARPLLETPDLSWPTDEQVVAALAAVAHLGTQLENLTGANIQAKEALAGVAAGRLALAKQRTTEVTDPSAKIRVCLQDLSNALDSALTALSEPPSACVPVEAPLVLTLQHLVPTLHTVQPRLADVLVVRRAMRGGLRADAEQQLADALNLHATSAAQFDPTDVAAIVPASKPSQDDLIKAVGVWETHETRERQRAEAADHQIERASRLDAAIAPARLRAAALKELTELLTPAKFPRFLIQTRTTQLLGIASEILGTLTDGELGFSDGFRIAVPGAGVTREPHTLSGGEKFLGALALSLALAEVHGHAGNRIEALFLDEGFDSLDLTHLAQALSVLRNETDHDRTVTIITHIYAVAELVDDVLLVKRGPAGSSMRWNTGNDLQDLLWADAAAGLHDIRAELMSANARSAQ